MNAAQRINTEILATKITHLAMDAEDAVQDLEETSAILSMHSIEDEESVYSERPELQRRHSLISRQGKEKLDALLRPPTDNEFNTFNASEEWSAPRKEN
jgi:hypothetical protein